MNCQAPGYPPRCHPGGSPLRQTTTPGTAVATNSIPRNVAGALPGGAHDAISQTATRYAINTAQPCHTIGNPQPQPYRFAGNQYCLGELLTSMSCTDYPTLEASGATTA